jgi:uncharacterized ion transporter superfamily protein YfcC
MVANAISFPYNLFVLRNNERKKDIRSMFRDNKNNKNFRPDAYVILFCVLVLVAILTYIIPAGSFERQTNELGITTIVPDSYKFVERQPIDFFDIFLAIQEGFIRASDMIFLVLIIGGTFTVIEKTGAIDALILKTIQKTKNREWLLFAAIISMLSILGGMGIISISVIAFIPIGISLAKAMNLDALVGVAVMYLGAYSGFAIGFMDPIRTGLAQQIAELPIYSGLAYRFVIFMMIVIVTLLYIIWYANRIKKDPKKSILAENRFPKLDVQMQKSITLEFNLRHLFVLTPLIFGIGIYIYGALRWDWSTNELAAMFILIALLTAIFDKMGANAFVQTFIDGCKNIFYGAAIIGLARGIVIVMENGMIIDTIVQGIYATIQSFSNVTGAIAMFIVHGLFNFVVSSGTAHASIMMPIMTPLADLMNIPRQVAVQAYTMGDGFTNVINPLSGTLMAILAISGIPLTKWFKFAVPLVLIWFAIGMIFMAMAVWINWGPM